MNERMIPWQPTIIAGPKQSLLVTPEIAKLMIQKSKRPLFVVGPYAKEDAIMGHVLDIAKRWSLPIVATADTYKSFADKNIIADSYGIVEITNLLKDPKWNGVNNEGSHDLVIFIGVIYYIASQGLSTLKHFAPHLKTLTLCKFFHSNADASFPNMNDNEWFNYLEKIKL
jgi:acetyl-CoA decarbonylase/synthase complex subunit epsilon